MYNYVPVYPQITPLQPQVAPTPVSYFAPSSAIVAPTSPQAVAPTSSQVLDPVNSEMAYNPALYPTLTPAAPVNSLAVPTAASASLPDTTAEVNAYLSRWSQNTWMSWFLNFVSSLRNKTHPQLKKAEQSWNKNYATVSGAVKTKVVPKMRRSTIYLNAEEKINRATEYADANIRLAWRRAGGFDGVLAEHIAQVAVMERYWEMRATEKGKEWENYLRAFPSVIALDMATRPPTPSQNVEMVAVPPAAPVLATPGVYAA